MSLASAIQVSYGTFVFPTETETEAVRLTPVYDSAGRTVVHTEFFLRVRAVLQNTGGTDTESLAYRRTLTTPGLALRVSGLGVGKINANAAGKRDVKWGPTPGSVSFKPLGAGNAVELTWEVTARLPDCADAAFTAPRVHEFCYALSFAIDDAGRTTRTYSGHVVIPQTRAAAGSRAVAASADALRADVVPAEVPGFRRTSQKFDLSEDKCRLDFSVTDTQLGAVVPPLGVVRVRVSHRRNSLAPTMGSWAETISGTYTLAPNAKPEAAARAFFALVSDRAKATLAAAQAQVAANGFSGQKAVIVPLEYSDGADFGSDDLSVATFSAKLRVTSSVWSMLACSSLWRAVPQQPNWVLWAASVPVGPRGHARLVFNPGDDKIADLCQAGAGPGAVLQTPNYVGAPPVFAALSGGFTAADSYLSYKAGVYAEPVTNNVVLKTLPGKAADVELRTPPADASPGAVDSAVVEAGASLTGGKGRAGAASPGADRPDGGNFSAGSAKPIDYSDVFFAVGGAAKTKPPAGAKPTPKPDPNVGTKKADAAVQQRATPTVYVTLFGQALRVGYPVPVPSLVSIDGVPLVATNAFGLGYGFWQAVVGSACGVPIYGARWKLLYVCEKLPPKGVPALPVAF